MSGLQPVKIIESATMVLPYSDVDTDQILPARFLTTTERKGLGKHAFADWRYDSDGNPNVDFVINRVPVTDHRILVAGANFGCGSSREHAAWALRDLGFEAIISTDIADIFRANALKNGLLPIVVDEKTHSWLVNNPAARLHIDLESQIVRLPNGDNLEFSIDNFSRYCLLNGLDELGHIFDNENEINEFERNHQPGVIDIK